MCGNKHKVFYYIVSTRRPALPFSYFGRDEDSGRWHICVFLRIINMQI